MSNKRAKPAKKKAPKLKAMEALAGVPVGDDLSAPTVDVTLPLGELARNIGALLHGSPLFNMKGRLVVVDEESGEMEDMNAVWFRSWLEDFALVGRHTAEGFRKTSISRDTAQGILENRVFRKTLRPLSAVNTVRLPVWTDNERTSIELLPAGYHERTAVFTVNSLPYSQDMDPDEARAYYLHFYEESPFAEDGELTTRRSYSAHMAALFTTYMLSMFPPDVPRPAFFYNGNQPELGKSTVARSALAFVHGAIASKNYKRNEEAFDKVIETVANECSPYFFLDNVEGKLYSQALCTFITEPVYSFRLMQLHRSGVGENRRVVFITANGGRAIKDMVTRILSIDLYLNSEPSSREFKHPITAKVLGSVEYRKNHLAAAWALVRYWSERGCPRLSRKTKTRFSEWEQIMGGLLECVELGNPFTQALMVMDDQGEAWRVFFLKLAATLDEPGTEVVGIDDCLQVATSNDILEDMLPEAKDNNRAFGQYVKRKHLRGWVFSDEQGRRCEFQKIPDSNKGSRYSITVHPP